MFLSALVSFMHFIAAFIIFSALVAQHLLLAGPVDYIKAKKIRVLNVLYAVSATLILVVGFLRAFYFEKGWDFYKTNGSFHGKVTFFVLLAALSIIPTIQFKKWSRVKTDRNQFVAPEGEVKKALLFVRIELVLLFVVLILASLMAKGIG